MSKIQFESESQRFDTNRTKEYNCKQLCQRYNLKANHNGIGLQGAINATVSNYVKDTI